MPTRAGSTIKQEINRLMRGSLGSRSESERIGYFCECDDPHCYKAVWLTAAEYDRRRRNPAWRALIDEHSSAASSPGLR
jgi:hypothetical protein